MYLVNVDTGVKITFLLFFVTRFYIFNSVIAVNPADSAFVPGGQLNSLLDAVLPLQARHAPFWNLLLQNSGQPGH
jgi:hypothetical protein